MNAGGVDKACKSNGHLCLTVFGTVLMPIYEWY